MGEKGSDKSQPGGAQVEGVGSLESFVLDHRREFDEKCADGFGRLEKVEEAVPLLLAQITDLTARVAWLESAIPAGEVIVGKLMDVLETVLADNRAALDESRRFLTEVRRRLPGA